MGDTRQPSGDVFAARITEVGDLTDLGIPHAYIEQRLEPASGLYVDHELGRVGTVDFEPAYRLDGESQEVDDIVFLRLRGWTRDDRVYDIISDTSSVQSQKVVRIVALVSDYEPEPCSGSSSSGSNTCIPYYYNAIVQSFDVECQQWVDGDCAFVFEIEGRRLELNRRYIASVAGQNLPAGLSASPTPCCYDCEWGDDSALLVVDAGTITRVIHVESHLGSLCGSGSTSVSSEGGSGDLDLYRGIAVKWNEESCIWDAIEDDVLIAHVRGCQLKIGKKYIGTVNKMIPNSSLGSGSSSGSGDGAGTCKPLYLTDRMVRRAVSDVLCVGGTIRVYKFEDDADCDDATYSNDAGCCDCGSGDSGTGSGDECPCSGNPTASQFEVSSFSLVDDGCSGCESFPSTFTMTNYSGGCEWLSGTLPNPCGGSLGASLTVTTAGADLYIGSGGTSAAHYSMSGSFNCNGENTLSLVSNSSSCSGWPSSITLTPV